MTTTSNSALLALAALLLAGCGDSDVREVRHLDGRDQGANPARRSSRLPEPKTFVPFAYNQRAGDRSV